MSFYFHEIHVDFLNSDFEFEKSTIENFYNMSFLNLETDAVPYLESHKLKILRTDSHAIVKHHIKYNIVKTRGSFLLRLI